jgi:hypothetical protein
MNLYHGVAANRDESMMLGVFAFAFDEKEAARKMREWLKTSIGGSVRLRTATVQLVRDDIARVFSVDGEGYLQV